MHSIALFRSFFQFLDVKFEYWVVLSNSPSKYNVVIVHSYHVHSLLMHRTVRYIHRIHRDTHFAFEIGIDLDSKLPFNLLLFYMLIIHTFPSLLKFVHYSRNTSSSFTMCKIYTYSRSRISNRCAYNESNVSNG